MRFAFPEDRHPTARRVARWGVAPLLLAAAVGVSATAFASASVVGTRAPASASAPASAVRIQWPGSGQSAVAVDGHGLLGISGAVTRPHPTASVAKVMDAYQVLLDHPIGVRDAGPTITVLPYEAAAYRAAIHSGQTLVAVASGERISERKALEAMLLPSGNNMARILARWDAGSISRFLARENATAARLGMRRTHFTDPAGVDSRTVSTAPDLIRLDEAAMAVPTFAQVVGETSARVPVAGVVHNHNRLLGRDGMLGVKTGWTGAAGGCLMFAARVQGARSHTYHMVYGVVLGQSGPPPAGRAFDAAVRLIAGARANL
ncbi:D-alanyl-D-alanine carboxypeptidase (penicillin-binding protein 5/6) [Catenulispora sp. MAP12-49]|uniref:D-alanyl-D-alanine carboxypeptidase family protein n=1 Tax=unclassified Catenulispora TaxID=414885 RepID=UPI003512DE66